MERTIFTCSVDRETWKMTGIMFFFLLFYTAFLWMLHSVGWFSLNIAPWLMTFLCIVVPIIIYGIQPRRLVISDDAIRLECPFRTKVIPRDAGMEVRRVRDYDTQFLVRKCGSNGVFGNWGLFGSKRWPRMHFYTKRGQKDWIMLRMGDGKIYILSPDDSEAFLRIFS
ncbi:MAG: PH domain-containing protein [Rikenella sp.]|nr:PH domain-containing protein [Rikenella sp.]